MKKVYAFGWCYWICGSVKTDIVTIMKNAVEFANEIGVPIKDVIFDGVIQNSSWCANYQQFGAPCKNPPEVYKPIDCSIWNYIK